MTTQVIERKTRLDPWILEIIVCEQDWPLIARRLQIDDINELHRFAADNAKEIAAANYDVYVRDLVQAMRNELLDADFNGIQRAFVNAKGTPLIVAPNYGKTPGEFDPDSFNEFDTPINKLHAEMDRLRSVRNGGGNGHT